MKNMVFQLNDTYWLQRTGTAMGTSVACSYATIFYSFHKETAILIPNNGLGILFYRRYIDDAFIIQLLNDDHFSKLHTTMNSFGEDPEKRLAWEVEEPSDSVNFLDLTISLTLKGTLSFCTYQKPMNLYTYIPPHSAHPPGVIKGLIHGSIRRFWKCNTLKEYFITVTKEFFQHLISRGHNSDNLQCMFTEAAVYLDATSNSTKSNSKTPDTDRPIILHQRFHPDQISRRALKETFHHAINPLATEVCPSANSIGSA